ncbi:WbqC family protein [Streptomonospora litoralis]|uniref:WbqC-like protein family protein n=1 Tax=Streptomonospora litoralis TaxID=2498135 RepID=A0A4P6PWL2_9ACTN|nr:WbqC family protein [Streptomonospora litoralis]QBI52030.1 WbqC-like protein family protein [Streptomonospora litoralis]
MRVAMHQPHYLPWLGLIDKADQSDLFVVLDHVQYERRGWQNRNYVAAKGGPVLLTVPVIQGARGERILDKMIDNSHPWREKHHRTLAEHCYRGAPFWEEFRARILGVYEQDWERLTDLATATTRTALDAFGIRTPIVRASELGEFPGQKSELLAQVAAKVGATSMLSGDGARDYIDTEVFHRYGIEVEWQRFQHPRYPQHNRADADFLPRMAALDLLVNAGPSAGLRLLRDRRADPEEG